jgi:hypothetical protein
VTWVTAHAQVVGDLKRLEKSAIENRGRNDRYNDKGTVRLAYNPGTVAKLSLTTSNAGHDHFSNRER